jgi:hypothetical protein
MYLSAHDDLSMHRPTYAFSTILTHIITHTLGAMGQVFVTPDVERAFFSLNDG